MTVSLPPPPAIPEGLEHMLPLFIAEMEKDAGILHSLADAPLADLAEHVHAMRGKCAMFGEDILFSLLTPLEQNCMAGIRDGNGALVVLIIERVHQLKLYDDALGTVPKQ